MLGQGDVSNKIFVLPREEHMEALNVCLKSLSQGTPTRQIIIIINLIYIAQFDT